MTRKEAIEIIQELWRYKETGHWFIDERPESDRETICSNCEQPIFKYHKLDFDYRPKYCPNCGAKMVEPYALNSKDRKVLNMAIKALEQEPCEDAIGRAEAILQIQRHGVGCFDPDEFSPEQAERFVINMLNGLPPVKPE